MDANVESMPVTVTSEAVVAPSSGPSSPTPPQPLAYEPPPFGPDVPQRGPWAELLLLALPTIAQMASYTVMQFGDTWMLAFLGVKEPTAAGNAGIFAFSIIGFGFGVLMCVNTLVSQNFGQRDYVSCGRYLWQGIWFGLAYAMIVFPFIPLAGRTFTLFGHEPQLVSLEVSYFTVAVIGTPVKMTSVALGQFLLAVNRPWVTMFASFCGAGINFFFNWLLIYGHWGFPKMGVAGAAWATNAAVLVEMSILLAVALSRPMRAKFNTTDAKPRGAMMKLLLSIGLSSGLQIVADVLAWGLFVIWVMGQFKTQAMAATNFVFRYLSVSFMPAFGIATAVTALVGRYIGAGRHDLAEHRAHLGFKAAAIYMLFCGCLYVIGRNVLMHLFTSDPEVLRIGAILLIFAGIYQLFDAMYIVYNGALRGAGDTFVPAVATAVLCWGITVFGGLAVAKLWPQFGPTGPWIMATLYGAILGIYLLARFRRGRWKSIRLEADAAVETPTPVDTVAVPS
jgi:MATE family multidrug resistance protein